ncbi:MAG: hypothetical protein ACK53Y_27790, partial [bacterium]
MIIEVKIPTFKLTDRNIRIIYPPSQTGNETEKLPAKLSLNATWAMYNHFFNAIPTEPRITYRYL